MRVPVSSLQLPVLVDGKLDPTKRGDDERYAQWMKEGKRPPPIEIVQTERGTMRVMDGHRRALATKLAGVKDIEAWVSYSIPTGKVGSDGNPIMTGLTFEMANPPALDLSPEARKARAEEMGFDTSEIAYRGLTRPYDGEKTNYYQMFTSNPWEASEYAMANPMGRPNVIAAYIRKGKNLEIDAMGRPFNRVQAQHGKLPADMRGKLDTVSSIDEIAHSARLAGYDTVTVRNVIDNATGEVIAASKQSASSKVSSAELDAILAELGPVDLDAAPPTIDYGYTGVPPDKRGPVTVNVVFDPSKNIRSVNAAFDPAQEASANLMAAVMPSIRRDARASAGAVLLKGREVTVREKVVRTINDAIAPHLGNVPDGVPVGALSSVTPVPGEAGRFAYEFTTPDGGTFRIIGDLSLLSNRAVFDPGTFAGGIPAIGFLHIANPTADLIVGDLYHEITHAVRRQNGVRADTWAALVGHANDLAILGMPVSEFKAKVGADIEGTNDGDQTIRELYSNFYSDRNLRRQLKAYDEHPSPREYRAAQQAADKQTRNEIEEESVAHMVQLYHHGALPDTPREIAVIIDSILDGSIWRVAQEGESAQGEMELMGAAQGSGAIEQTAADRWVKSVDDQLSRYQKEEQRLKDEGVNGPELRRRLSTFWTGISDDSHAQARHFQLEAHVDDGGRGTERYSQEDVQHMIDVASASEDVLNNIPLSAGHGVKRPDVMTGDLVTMYQNGLTTQEIGDAVGLNAASVSRRLAKTDVTMRRSGSPFERIPEEMAKIRSMLRAGESYSAVAKQLGITKGKVAGIKRDMIRRGQWDDIMAATQKGKTRLAAMHNLSAENLTFADKMGGIAVPSIGVVKEGMGMGHGFGEITMIGRKNLGDPEQNPVFDADAWSTRFPRPEYKTVPMAKAQKFVDAMRPYGIKFEDTGSYDQAWDHMVNRAEPERNVSQLLRSEAAQAMFLDQVKGKKIEPVMRSAMVGATYPWVDTAAFRSFLSSAPADWFHSEPQNEVALKAAIGQAISDAIDEYTSSKKMTSDGRALDAEDQAHFRELYRDRAVTEDNQPYMDTYRLKQDADRIGKKAVDSGKTRERLERAIKPHEAEFKSWVENQIIPLHGEPRIKVGGRFEPYTLENIVRVMTAPRSVTAQEDHMTFGEGKARAAAATRIGSLEEARNRADWQMADEKGVNEARDRAKALLEDWRTAVVPHNKYVRANAGQSGSFGSTFEALDGSMRALAAWAKRGRDAGTLRSALAREDFTNVPQHVLDLGIEAGKAFMEAPVPYFESKPQRAVKLNEFAGAVIPKTASDETRAILDKHGILYREYDSKKEDAKDKVAAKFTQELARQGQDTLFAYGGMQSPDANITDYTQAVIMAKRGASPQEIWDATGWFKNPKTGKWEFETTRPEEIKTVAEAKTHVERMAMTPEQRKATPPFAKARASGGRVTVPKPDDRYIDRALAVIRRAKMN